MIVVQSHFGWNKQCPNGCLFVVVLSKGGGKELGGMKMCADLNTFFAHYRGYSMLVMGVVVFLMEEGGLVWLCF